MRGLRLRPAEPDDALRLVQIHMQARAAAMPWLPVLHTPEETQGWLANVVLSGQDVWIAEYDSEALGFIALAPDWVEHLYIDPTAWHGGMGSALLTLAKERLSGGFRLWTFQRNAMARGFYRKHGLAEIRYTDGSDNEEKEPDVLLGWKLTS